MPKLSPSEALAKKYDTGQRFRSDARASFLSALQAKYFNAVSTAQVINKTKKDVLIADYNATLAAGVFEPYQGPAKLKERLEYDLALSDAKFETAASAAAAALHRGQVKEVIIPAWNDIIHLSRPLSFSEKELDFMDSVRTLVDVQGRSVEDSAKYLDLSVAETAELLDLARGEQTRVNTAQEKIKDMFKSPTPAFASNLGVVMTALDDIQDFTTTVGVASRLLGRVVPLANEVAVVSFTIGEALNRFNIINRISGGEVSKLCRLLREARNSSHKATISADVDRRMKRLFPSKGEIIEIAQTTDSLFGVGVSLGPLVGLATDLISGAFIGAPVRFRDWKISAAEYETIQTLGGLLDISDVGFGFALGEDIDRADTTGYKVLPTGIPPPKYSAAEILSRPALTQADLRLALVEGFSLNESAALLVASGVELPWDDYLRSLVALIDSNLTVRKKEVVKALKEIWQVIWPYAAKPPKKTKMSTKLFMQSLGIDPYGSSDWPIEGLGSSNTLQEIQEAFEASANKSLVYWREKLGSSAEGLFLDACVKEIGSHAAVMFSAVDGVITESLEPYTLIYVKSLESHLNPPSDTSDSLFSEWINFVLSRMREDFQSVPDRPLLQAAYERFF